MLSSLLGYYLRCQERSPVVCTPSDCGNGPGRSGSVRWQIRLTLWGCDFYDPTRYYRIDQRQTSLVDERRCFANNGGRGGGVKISRLRGFQLIISLVRLDGNCVHSLMRNCFASSTVTVCDVTNFYRTADLRQKCGLYLQDTIQSTDSLSLTPSHVQR